MAVIVTRAGKGSPLTNNEVDANFLNLNTDKYEFGAAAGFSTTLIGPAASANFTRFPNALSVVSNIASGVQHDESLYIGQMSEATSVGDTWGSGVYGAGYTNSTGAGRGTGVTGEGHVSAASDTGVAVGVRGYATDAHTGNYNIGLYGDAENGGSGLAFGGNVALFLANGNIVTSASATKTWYMGGGITFNGQGTTKTIGVTNGAVFALGTPSSGTLTNCTGYTYANLAGSVPTWNQNTTGSAATLTTARTINGVGFDGSVNITVADSTKLPLSGGTMTGAISFAAGQTWPTFNQNTTGSAATFTSTTQNSQFNSVGVGTAGSGTAGEIRATNNITAYYSDIRLKTKIGEITDALAKVRQIETLIYHANETAVALGYDASVIEVGVNAQSVKAVQPEVVVPAPIDDKYWTVRYERLVPLLIEAIKELDLVVAKLVD